LHRFALATFLVSIPTLVLADHASADRCAAGLAPEPRLIYDRVMPQLKPNSAVRDVVTATVRGMVIEGAIPQATARASAMAAGQCIKLAR
jgi:hypothetical protein